MCFTSGRHLHLVFLLLSAAVAVGQIHRIRKRSVKCVLPPFPQNGYYAVAGEPSAKPGDEYDSVSLNITCDQGHNVPGNNMVSCLKGSWSSTIPRCESYCKLEKNPSVEYFCSVSGEGEDEHPCNSSLPSGTVVKPECNSPNYYSDVTPLPIMNCKDGSWDYVADCVPECGRVTPEGVPLIIDGIPAKRGELPWHAGIYRKTFNPYMQICGGSLVTSNVVISAAHCFWTDVGKKQPASNFAVALGKLYRPWNNPRDEYAAKTDVKDLKIPRRFQGSAANFQHDIALLILQDVIEYRTYIRPVCLDFENNLNRRQLQPGDLGKVAGWGLTAENGKASQTLLVVQLPYVDIDQCIKESPPNFREYITGDKMCAGYVSGRALCKGDSGGGLAFPEVDRGSDRYYLFGIVSTAPSDTNLCNAHALTTFTEISKHERFIKKHLPKSVKCILPPYPEHGIYAVTNAPYATPGQGFRSVQLNVTCTPGYELTGNAVVFCQDGVWPQPVPKCVRYCKLQENKSVNYYCPVPGGGEGRRRCNTYEPSGTVVTPECKGSKYFTNSSSLAPMRCVDGTWNYIARCTEASCKLDKHPSVNYYCLDSNDIYDERICDTLVPSDIVVRPECKLPNYRSPGLLFNMRCINGSWDYIAVCTPECGRMTPQGDALVIGGTPAKQGELPWHAGIYQKTYKPYRQICAGSLVSTTVVISVAHCFWTEGGGKQPASNYAVALGKLFRAWDNPMDVDAQKSDVKEIAIPVRFQGAKANYQDNIAILVLETAIEYRIYIRPVCLDFDIQFNGRQLQPGKLGKVAGWGLISENGKPADLLQVVQLPFVDIEQCIKQSPPDFLSYITSDKICAGYTNGTALCRGDSGGGLAFPEIDRGIDRYYLRGIVSTAPASKENLCDSRALTAFTEIIKHESFLKQYRYIR